MSHSTVMRLNLSFVQQEELSNCARTLALQCATKVCQFIRIHPSVSPPPSARPSRGSFYIHSHPPTHR